MLRAGFMVSNNGSTMRAVVQKIADGGLAAKAVLVVSNKHNAPALLFANEAGIPACIIPVARDPVQADLALCRALEAAMVDIVILSGYLRKLGPVTLRVFQNRILNTHPALLPAFGGPGMYGRRVHDAVLAARVTESGATIHLVDDEYDHGAIIAQRSFPVPPGISANDLERLAMQTEQSLMIDTLRKIEARDIRLPPASCNPRACPA